MNSVLGIGENIIFVKQGHKEWSGSKEDIFQSDNVALNDFVFATDLFQNVKQYIKEGSVNPES